MTSSNKDSNKAFTIIEFLVALVVIGFIIAIITHMYSTPNTKLVNKVNAAKVFQDMNKINEARKYYDYTHNETTARWMSEDFAANTWMSGIPAGALCGAGTIRVTDKGDITCVAVPQPMSGWPKPPASITNGAFGGTQFEYRYECDTIWPGCATILPYITEDVCSALNRDFNGSETIPPWGTETDRAFGCFLRYGTDFWVVRQN